MTIQQAQKKLTAFSNEISLQQGFAQSLPQEPQTFAPAKNTETSVRAIDKLELTRADVRDQRPGVGHVVAARGSGQKTGSLRTSQK